jgi:division protein CdvB (Snf7/Vps24/ESCRT-III family)
MIMGALGRSKKSTNELLLEAIRELGKYYSRLELAYMKLIKRDKELFDECTSYLSWGHKNRAIVYANEVAEIRKIIRVIQGVQLNLERVILRLETLRTMTPTLEDIKGVFGEVKGVLEDVAKIMPSLTPEMNNLANSINDFMMATEVNIVPPEPLAVKSEAAEAILKEASEFLRQEIERKIPEPPEDIPVPKPAEAIKPRIALTIDGSEAYIGEDNSIIGEINDQMNTLAEDLILDYIERNNGVMKISKCAEELNMSKTKVMQILDSLSRKGKIRIE